MILTKPDKELARLVRNTVPGMAFWAGTGPSGTTCGMCKNLVGRTTRCQKYYTMMNKKWGRKNIDINTPSCKYYDAKKVQNLSNK